jgi:hypothetical protein
MPESFQEIFAFIRYQNYQIPLPSCGSQKSPALPKLNTMVYWDEIKACPTGRDSLILNC